MKEQYSNSLNVLCEALPALAGLYRFNMRLGLKRAVLGIPLPRCLEYSWLLRRLYDKQPLKVLDVGPWRSPLPLFMASLGHSVTAVDVPEGIGLQRRYFGKRVVRKIPSSPPVELIEGRLPELPVDDAAYDVVTAVSTFEHFPDDGDTRAMRESARVLKPGGRLLLTVPCRTEYEETRFGNWFERRYDASALRERLIEPSEMRLVEEFHIYDARVAKFAGFYWKVPRLLRAALGWSIFFLARHYIKKGELPTLRDSGACLCLQK